MCARQGGNDDDYEDEGEESDDDESEEEGDASEEVENLDEDGEGEAPDPSVKQMIAQANVADRALKQKQAKESKRAQLQAAQESQLSESDFDSGSEADAAGMSKEQMMRSMMAMQRHLMGQTKMLEKLAANQTSAQTPPSASKFSLKSKADGDHPATGFVVHEHTKTFGSHRVLVRASSRHARYLVISRSLSLSLSLSLSRVTSRSLTHDIPCCRSLPRPSPSISSAERTRSARSRLLSSSPPRARLWPKHFSSPSRPRSWPSSFSR